MIRRTGLFGRSIINPVIWIEAWLPPSPKTLALIASLVVSALLTAAALRLPGSQWLAWISFLPLFVVVRTVRPSAAALAGGFWGGCLYLFFCLCATQTTPVVVTARASAGSSAWLFGLLIVIPAVYVGLASRPARTLGLKLLTLALGWTLIEVVLHLYNSFTPQDGLLTGSQAEAQHLHWFARLFGYVVTAFLVACVNASLLGIVAAAQLISFPVQRLWAPSTDPARSLSQIALVMQFGSLCQVHPRAPPFFRANQS